PETLSLDQCIDEQGFLNGDDIRLTLKCDGWLLRVQIDNWLSELNRGVRRLWRHLRQPLQWESGQARANVLIQKLYYLSNLVNYIWLNLIHCRLILPVAAFLWSQAVRECLEPLGRKFGELPSVESKKSRKPNCRTQLVKDPAIPEMLLNSRVCVG